ncbi:MAG TPA: hypothetical protein VFM04_01005 [Candidatus Methylomirabilis sp.]|nr:hypothetical protein [Candidatus Methylomirabilis sp.]
MLSITGYLRNRFRSLWNERGAETAEWMIIVGLLTAVALIIYAAPAGPIGAMISAVALAIQNAVTGAV